MDRIAELFARCHRENRAALIIYSCCGYPAPGADETAFETAIAAGADIIELGVPFSDPMADGPVICTASQRALANGTKFRDVLALAGRLRQRHPETGIIVFSYMNVLYNFGLERLCTELAAIGVDGILAVDLPLEERDELLTLCRKNQLHLIPLVAPETPDERAEKIVAPATGFVYCVSRNGVTGESAGTHHPAGKTEAGFAGTGRSGFRNFNAADGSRNRPGRRRHNRRFRFCSLPDGTGTIPNPGCDAGNGSPPLTATIADGRAAVRFSRRCRRDQSWNFRSPVRIRR